jgi:hypothetical protein
LGYPLAAWEGRQRRLASFFASFVSFLVETIIVYSVPVHWISAVPLTPDQRTKMLVLSREAANAFVEDMVEIRRVLANEGASTAEVRRLSNILRRLLVGRDLATIAAPRMGRVEILAPDTRPIYKYEKITPLRFCIIGGAKIFGWSGLIRVMAFDGVSHPDQIPPDQLHPKDFNPEARVALRVDNFLAQRVICFRGEWVSRRSIIKYVANVASGVHSTAPKSREDTILALIRALSHIRRDVAGGSVHIQIPDPQLGQVPQETDFKTIAPDSIDPVLIELLATARFFVESPDIVSLETGVKIELGI